jgi:hypothetical protein
VADGGRYSADIAEAALAHTIGDKTVAAYHRTDLFDPRRMLMAEWGEVARFYGTVWRLC